MKIIINVEAQKDFYPGYHIETRMIFYLARQISAQKETEFHKSDYDGIKKCYSIWICMQAPEHIGNAISVYRMGKEDLVPGIPDNAAAYDKVEGVVITLNEKKTTTDEFLGLLNTLISVTDSVAEKKDKLQSYGLEVTGDIERGINSMCNYSDIIEENSISKEKKNTIKRMTVLGMDVSLMAKITALSIEEVEKIQKELGIIATV